MPVIEIFKLSIEALRANKFRTALTMLGMTVGTFAVVLLVSIGQGAKNYIFSEFQGLGSNLIVIQPGRSDQKSPFRPPIGTAKRKMTQLDVTALERRATHLEAVTGLLFGTATAKFEDAVANIEIFGSNEKFPQILTLPVEEGDFFTREEDQFGRRVIVIGANVAKNLFSHISPLGHEIKLNNSQFRVIGVLLPQGDRLGFNLDDFGFIPTTTALRLFNEDKLFGIRAKASSRSSIDYAVAEIREILTERRDGEEDFTIITQGAMMSTMGTILNMLSYVLGGIASISMLVGGIGIMNIMLINVTERIPEIGIRRAVGARRRDIVHQFLTEAVFLSILSGLMGIVAALSLDTAIFWWNPHFDMRAPWWVAPLAFLLCLVVGILSGFWPARKASMIETLEALRRE